MMEVVEWIHLAQNNDQWRNIVNTNEPLGFIKGREISWLAERLLASLEGLGSMELVNSES
jgi:hypothetical protein